MPGSPHVVFVDGASGEVRGEGTGQSLRQVAQLLARATGDPAFLAGTRAAEAVAATPPRRRRSTGSCWRPASCPVTRGCTGRRSDGTWPRRTGCACDLAARVGRRGCTCASGRTQPARRAAHPDAYGSAEESRNPVLHLANFALPPGRGDFGTGRGGADGRCSTRSSRCSSTTARRPAGHCSRPAVCPVRPCASSRPTRCSAGCPASSAGSGSAPSTAGRSASTPCSVRASTRRGSSTRCGRVGRVIATASPVWSRAGRPDDHLSAGRLALTERLVTGWRCAGRPRGAGSSPPRTSVGPRSRSTLGLRDEAAGRVRLGVRPRRRLRRRLVGDVLLDQQRAQHLPAGHATRGAGGRPTGPRSAAARRATTSTATPNPGTPSTATATTRTAITATWRATSSVTGSATPRSRGSPPSSAGRSAAGRRGSSTPASADIPAPPTTTPPSTTRRASTKHNTYPGARHVRESTERAARPSLTARRAPAHRARPAHRVPHASRREPGGQEPGRRGVGDAHRGRGSRRARASLRARRTGRAEPARPQGWSSGTAGASGGR